MSSKRTTVVALIAVLAAAGIGGGFWYANADMAPSKSATRADAGSRAKPASATDLRRDAANAPSGDAASTSAGGSTPARPALTVTSIRPAAVDWPQTLVANGNVAAWQEAVVGSEIGGFRLTEVKVNVGDEVEKGDLLARVSSSTVKTDMAQSRAAIAEAKATLAEAEANAERARQLQVSGAISAQQINQYVTAAETAKARLAAAQAKLDADALRLSQTRIVAPDDGVISSRSATVGAVVQNGQELFRLIRKGRLEWRAEVTAAELERVRPGMAVRLTPTGTAPIVGHVRMVAPTIDQQTRNGLVYVDLPSGSGARAGMFARGEFEIGHARASTVPQSAVLVRDGFSYVFVIGRDSRVVRTKVTVGRRVDDRIEIAGLPTPDVDLVENGAAFLADGDVVRVVASAAGSAAAPAPVRNAP